MKVKPRAVGVEHFELKLALNGAGQGGAVLTFPRWEVAEGLVWGPLRKLLPHSFCLFRKGWRIAAREPV